MPTLNAKARAALPDSAFAYIDSRGRRRLPINDEAHVRNALSRFDQTTFEDEAARDRARTRLLRAAKKYGIVPVGFIGGQLLSARTKAEVEARSSLPASLPSGIVTFLMTDVENSTGLVQQLGDRYSGLLSRLRRMLVAAVRASGGSAVDIRADEMFAVFKHAPAALEAAISMQRKIVSRAWPGNARFRIRAGLHTGRPTLTETGYVGLAVNMAARVCSAAHGGQILVSRGTKDAMGASIPADVSFRELGQFKLQGIPTPEALFQVMAADLPHEFPIVRMRRRRRQS